ncbi:hypothetical protein LJK87_41840 [Paenibacillus sp. P25]|nr:hypothetical protein LJK87_41840 [Paenibacillus sp. P25]
MLLKKWLISTGAAVLLAATLVYASEGGAGQSSSSDAAGVALSVTLTEGGSHTDPPMSMGNPCMLSRLPDKPMEFLEKLECNVER